MFGLLRQYRHHSATRFGLAFACLWVAFAAVPCSAMGDLAAAHGHASPLASSAMSESHHCPHCPDAQVAKATPGTCTGLDDAVVTKVANFDLTLAGPAALPQLAQALDAGRVVKAPWFDVPPPLSVPLNLRYCTFIE